MTTFLKDSDKFIEQKYGYMRIQKVIDAIEESYLYTSPSEIELCDKNKLLKLLGWYR